MYYFIKFWFKVMIALLYFALTPISVLWQKKDKILHCFIPMAIQLLAIFFPFTIFGSKIDGRIGFFLLIGAIIKEEILDEFLGMGEKDLLDIYWSFKGVIWATIFGLIIKGVLL